MQHFEKHHSALFVPVSLIYQFQLSTEKLEKWPFQGWEGRGYQTVNNGILPRVLTIHYETPMKLILIITYVPIKI